MIAQEVPRYEELGEAERIAVLYAAQSLRPRYRSLLLLDAQLARIALSAREPMLAQLKLAWWRDAIADPGEAPAQPLVQELATSWPEGPARLTILVDGWERVAVGEGGFLAVAEAVAEARAAACAAAARAVPNDAIQAASRRWTLVTLARLAPDAQEREAMLATARGIGRAPLARGLRPLALLDGLARRALRRGGGALLGDRLSPLAALRLGIFGR